MKWLLIVAIVNTGGGMPAMQNYTFTSPELCNTAALEFEKSNKKYDFFDVIAKCVQVE